MVDKCGSRIFTNNFTSTGKLKPQRKFVYQKLQDWLASRLWMDGFEDLLVANHADHSQPNAKVMPDIWHGSVWNNFKGGVREKKSYTSTPGNLVFSLYIDWFNPYGNKMGKRSKTIGAIILTCLNLPPLERYRQENLYVYGIIPGPQEPKLDQINHLLQPLVDKFQEFLEGVWFTETHNYVGGQLIRAVIIPLIADLPALRKVAGFSSHALDLFCSFCMASKKNLNETDISKFQHRTHDEHIENSLKWKDSTSFTKKANITKEHGVRWSVLNELPYWRPIEFCTIELMHALILGNLKDFSQSFLLVSLAGSELEKHLEFRKNFNLPSSSITEPYIALSERRIEKRNREVEIDNFPAEDSQHRKRSMKLTEDNLKKYDSAVRRSECLGQQARSENVGPSQQRTIKHKPGSLAFVASPKSARLTSLASKSLGSRSSSVRQQIPSLSSLNPIPSEESLDGESLDLDERVTIQSHHFGPRLHRVELECIQKVISETDIPSWLTRIPTNFGFRSSSSLKAAQWHFLSTVYYPLALIPLWTFGWRKDDVKHVIGDNYTQQEILLKALVSLLTFTNLLCQHQIHEENLKEIEISLKSYRSTVQLGWPQHVSKPNLHISQHYPEFIQKFAPPRSHAAWAHERLNGILGKIPKNNHMGEC